MQTHEAHPCAPLTALALLLASSCGGGFNEDAVVNCTTLTRVPVDVAGDLDSETLLEGLAPGQAQAVLLWTTGQGTVAYVSQPARGEALTNLFKGWAVQAKLQCLPTATTSIHLGAPEDAPRPLSVGRYPFSRYGFDVPDLEQSDEPDSAVLLGDVVVADVGDGTITGWLDGTGTVDLKSNFGQRPLEIGVEIIAMAFNGVRLLDDYGSEEQQE